MRHGGKINRLGRETARRTSTLANMACSLIEHKRINTTSAKAKALKIFVEPLVARLKNDTTHSHRITFSKLRNKYTVTELFKGVVTKVDNRPSGHTRIIRLGNRLGDNAETALIRFIDYSTTYNAAKVVKKKITRRGGKKATAGEIAQPVQTTEVAAE